MNRMILCILISATKINGQFAGDPFGFQIPNLPFRNPFNFPLPLSPFANFPNVFNPIAMRRMGLDIQLNLEEKLKPLKIKQVKAQMQNGAGGVTLIESPGKTLLKKDGTLLECLGIIMPQKPYCHGTTRRFQIQKQQDFCFSEQYFRLNDALCFAHPGQTGVSFRNNNEQYSCSGSDKKPAFLISLQEYQRLCGKLPWEKTYHYYPDPANPFHVRLPNPDLGCADFGNSADVCVFKA